MQYQFVIFFLNMIILIILYVLMRDQKQKLKLLIATTLFAYGLAVVLPYVLQSIPFKWVILLYGLAIILLCLILDRTLYKNQLAAAELRDSTSGNIPATEWANTALDSTFNPFYLQLPSDDDDHHGLGFPSKAIAVKAKIETAAGQGDAETATEVEGKAKQSNPEEVQADTEDSIAVPAPSQTAASTIDLGLSHPEFEITEAEANIVAAEIQTTALDIPKEHPLDEPVQAIPAAVETLEYYNGAKENLDVRFDIDETDIEQLIMAAFVAKDQDDFKRALKIFERALDLGPPEDVAQLIQTDIEILTDKLYAASRLLP